MAFKWVTGILTPLITGRGPPCRDTHLILEWQSLVDVQPHSRRWFIAQAMQMWDSSRGDIWHFLLSKRSAVLYPNPGMSWSCLDCCLKRKPPKKKSNVDFLVFNPFFSGRDSGDLQDLGGPTSLSRTCLNKRNGTRVSYLWGAKP